MKPRIFLSSMSTGAVGIVVSLLGFPKIGAFIIWLAMLMFLVFFIMYFIKFLTKTKEVINEMKHPMMSNFFAAIYISIGVIIAGILNILMKTNLDFGLGIPLATAFYILGLILLIPIIVLIPFLNFISSEIDTKHTLGFWYLPPVGIFVFIFAGNFLAMKGVLTETIKLINPLLFGVALFWWLVRMTFIFYRMKFHPLPPGEFAPNFVIGIAPPAVSTIAALTFSELIKNDLLQNIAVGFGVLAEGFGIWWALIALLVLSYYIIKNQIKFTLGFWAFVFPPAAFAISSYILHNYVFPGFFYTIFVLFGLIAVLNWIYVSYKTLTALIKKEKLQ